jgi:hypothetical protein
VGPGAIVTVTAVAGNARNDAGALVLGQAIEDQVAASRTLRARAARRAIDARFEARSLVAHGRRIVDRHLANENAAGAQEHGQGHECWKAIRKPSRLPVFLFHSSHRP